MSVRKRRRFSEEYKADAVRLYRESKDSIQTVADNLGIGSSSLERWVKQADVDEGRGSEGDQSSAEKVEIRELKRRLALAEMENEFLKKAAAYFAKETGNSK